MTSARRAMTSDTKRRCGAVKQDGGLHATCSRWKGHTPPHRGPERGQFYCGERVEWDDQKETGAPSDELAPQPAEAPAGAMRLGWLAKQLARAHEDICPTCQGAGLRQAPAGEAEQIAELMCEYDIVDAHELKHTLEDWYRWREDVVQLSVENEQFRREAAARIAAPSACDLSDKAGVKQESTPRAEKGTDGRQGTTTVGRDDVALGDHDTDRGARHHVEMPVSVAPGEALRALRDEMNEALAAGGLFNPESLDLHTRNHENALLRWRDAIEAVLAALPAKSSAPLNHWAQCRR